MILGLSAATAAVAATGAVSSFAWFVGSYSVTAKDMTIKAITNEAFLQIKQSEQVWTDTSKTYTEAVALYTSRSVSPTVPTKTVVTKGATTFTAYDGADAPCWAYGAASAKDDEAVDSNGYYDVTDEANDWSATESEITNGYTLYNKFTLRLRPVTNTTSSTVATVKELTASVAWATDPTGDSNNLKNAVRVLIWNETDSKGVVYTPGTANTTDLLSSNKMKSVTDGSEDRDIQVWVYFDGTANDCYSDNIPSVETDNSYSVKITFSVKDATHDA